ncbi:hypothetical protein L1987_46363 [Smallanthus sonchifolius]|uniref:Uncharacterized protein n=1 Tax=Smallanthus sonchifolius TaxID=185202 RepID=A0ACB9G199_9ASTR|nr:hypothetical protein L1987_46363 [Smallanthus sonchifolius]
MKIVVWGPVACVLFTLLLYVGHLVDEEYVWPHHPTRHDESGYVAARLPFPRAAYTTGPELVKTVDLNLPDHQHDHALGKCPMWLSAESSGTKLDAHTPSITKKDLKSYVTSPRRENTVSASMRLEQPKARTRENARKRTHLPKKVTFKNIEKGEPSTRAPPVLTPQEPTQDYIQLYG